MSSFALRLPLPFPPSVNHYYRHVGNKVLISKDGREYRKRVGDAVRREPDWPTGSPVMLINERLAVTLSVYPPDKRRRDLDNIQKPLLDALQHAGVYADDSQIDWLLTRRHETKPGGIVLVDILPAELRNATAGVELLESISRALTGAA